MAELSEAEGKAEAAHESTKKAVGMQQNLAAKRTPKGSIG